MHFSKITYIKGKRVVLDNVSFNLSRDGINWILGPNGAGKSSLLMIISGMEFKFTGQLPKEIVTTDFHSVGYALGNGSFYGHLTIKDHLSYYASHYQLNHAQLSNKLEYWELLPLLNQQVGKLSMGQLSRFTLAISTLNDPNILLLDEPESSLDFRGIRLLQQRLVCWRRPEMTAVIASHFPRNIQLLDSILVLDHGAVLFQGPVQELLKNPIEDYHEYLYYLQNSLIENL